MIPALFSQLYYYCVSEALFSVVWRSGYRVLAQRADSKAMVLYPSCMGSLF